jgi:hypothetical protein
LGNNRWQLAGRVEVEVLSEERVDGTCLSSGFTLQLPTFF